MANTAPFRWSAKMLAGYAQPRTRKEHTEFLLRPLILRMFSTSANADNAESV